MKQKMKEVSRYWHTDDDCKTAKLRTGMFLTLMIMILYRNSPERIRR